MLFLPVDFVFVVIVLTYLVNVLVLVVSGKSLVNIGSVIAEILLLLMLFLTSSGRG